jgi:hypothetical protein
MSFSLDVPSISSLKAEARALRQDNALAGTPMSQGAALEAIARKHGYRDWNTAHASLPERIATPVQVGERVTGTYLGQAFSGLVLGVQLLADMQHYKVTVKFDQPVDVVKSNLFSAFRQRVVATLDVYGVSPARTGNAEPQMRLKRVR